jgi:2-dehydro-3-deoxyphosphogalactonate aldolase
MTIDDVLADGAPPIMAILRGIRPDEGLAIGGALVDAGIRLIEVPFNSPEPLRSIRILLDTFGGQAAIGGGTVLTTGMVDGLADIGGSFVVSPNTDTAVIAHAIARGLETLPGFTTPTEAFTAAAAGARRLKLFPGSAFGPGYLAALAAVRPDGVRLWAVGGADATNLDQWLAAGAEGIGVGGALYRPGDGPDAVRAGAADLVAAWKNCPRPNAH